MLIDQNQLRTSTQRGDVVTVIGSRRQIDTRGGTYVEGVTAHEFVARDKIVITGDQQYDVRGLANPYLGLQSFTYADCAKYAGREKLIADAVARLATPDDPLTLLFVTGASGSGKSSFVQAGVLPALEKHYAALSVDEVKVPVVEDKWLSALAAAVQTELDRVSQALTGRIKQLADAMPRPWQH
jgi:hypothetical protein